MTKQKYLYYWDGFVLDVHEENISGEVSLERAKEIAKEYDAILLDEDLEEMK